MSDAATKLPRQPSRRERSIYQVHYGLKKGTAEMASPWPYLHLQAYDSQVAGHRNQDPSMYLGLLQCNNGTVLKPIIKEAQRREVCFYRHMQETTNADLIELRQFIAKYYGCREFTYNNHENQYIILEDLAEGMLEPCIMDAKIGRRTWDPLATEEKIRSERAKYALCRREFAFCIPGFQVYRLATGKLHKYGKDYGKKLHGEMVREAILTFLNGVESNLCRTLILQFLSSLWQIQRWAHKQTAVRIYSASLLLVYDARTLRDCCGDSDDLMGKPKCIPPHLAARRKSVPSINHTEAPSFSGQLSPKGPVFKKVNSVPISSITLAQQTFNAPPSINSPWSDALEKMNSIHSFEHNYEDKLCKIKMNYRALLDQLSSDDPKPRWGTVKLIDFAHAFFNEDEGELDENFRDGIDGIVEVFEGLLKETDDQVF